LTSRPLTYLRDRLLLVRDLLSESGSCFLQISDENLHRARALMDEVFDAKNFVSVISFRKKTMPLGAKYLESVNDFILWYAKSKMLMKYRQLFVNKEVEGDTHWNYVELRSVGLRRVAPSQGYWGYLTDALRA
jgi:adenine-specific DNA-methyltransferase